MLQRTYVCIKKFKKKTRRWFKWNWKKNSYFMLDKLFDEPANSFLSFLLLNIFFLVFLFGLWHQSRMTNRPFSRRFLKCTNKCNAMILSIYTLVPLVSFVKSLQLHIFYSFFYKWHHFIVYTLIHTVISNLI